MLQPSPIGKERSCGYRKTRSDNGGSFSIRIPCYGLPKMKPWPQHIITVLGIFPVFILTGRSACINSSLTKIKYRWNYLQNHTSALPLRPQRRIGIYQGQIWWYSRPNHPIGRLANGVEQMQDMDWFLPSYYWLGYLLSFGTIPTPLCFLFC